VKQWIDSHGNIAEAIEKVSTLMAKASNLKTAARLRELTLDYHGVSLKAVRENVTRWTSVFSMVKRYLRIKQQLDDCDGLAPFLLDGPQHNLIKKVNEDFEIFHMITSEIQAKGVNLLHVRLQFGTLCADPRYACMREHLNPAATIVQSKHFESGVRNIILGNHTNLTDDERVAVERLIDPKKLEAQREALQEQEGGAGGDGTAGRGARARVLSLKEKLALNIKKRKIGADLPGNITAESMSVYVDVGKLICATSNCCERL